MTTSICNSPAREREKIYVITELYREGKKQGYRVTGFFIGILLYQYSSRALRQREMKRGSG